MKKQQAIKEAKKYAKDFYENAMKRCNAYNPNYKRTWVKVGTGYALSGSPFKMHVFVKDELKKVIAADGAGTILKTYKIDLDGTNTRD